MKKVTLTILQNLLTVGYVLRICDLNLETCLHHLPMYWGGMAVRGCENKNKVSRTECLNSDKEVVNLKIHTFTQLTYFCNLSINADAPNLPLLRTSGWQQAQPYLMTPLQESDSLATAYQQNIRVLLFFLPKKITGNSGIPAPSQVSFQRCPTPVLWSTHTYSSSGTRLRVWTPQGWGETRHCRFRRCQCWCCCRRCCCSPTWAECPPETGMAKKDREGFLDVRALTPLNNSLLRNHYFYRRY